MQEPLGQSHEDWDPRKYEDAPGIVASLPEPKRRSGFAGEEAGRLKLQKGEGGEATGNLEVEQQPIWQQDLKMQSKVITEWP